MKPEEALDRLAKVIDEPRRKYRHRDIRRAFTVYTDSLYNQRRPWWKLIGRKKVKT